MLTSDMFISVDEVAEILLVHPRTVARMAARGDLPAVKIGPYWRIHRAKLEKWLDEASDFTPGMHHEEDEVDEVDLEKVV